MSSVPLSTSGRSEAEIDAARANQAGCGAVVLRLESWGPRALDGTSVCHGKPRVSQDTERSGGVHPQSGSRRSATEMG